MGEREETAGEAVQGLTGEPGSVMLVRPVPPQRASIARRLLAAHPVPLGSGLEPGFAGPGVAVWELCDPAAGDEPPLALSRLREAALLSYGDEVLELTQFHGFDERTSRSKAGNSSIGRLPGTGLGRGQ
jgi:hypothetical protein